MRQEFDNLLEITNYFSDKEVCKKYLEKLRWPKGNITCPHCDSSKKIYKTKRNYKCSECGKQFSVRKGTIFENSPIPLQKWFVAIYLISSHKKGISSVQLGKDIGVTQKTAWFMLHRIRLALANQTFKKLDNVVEVDETYVGGKNKNRHKSKKIKGSQGRSNKGKTPVFGLLQRGGEILAMKVDSVSSEVLGQLIEKHVELNSQIMSDEWKGYARVGVKFKHLQVNHSIGKFVIGDAHTNTIEGFWAQLKRGIFGIYHFVSYKHLDRYIEEFRFRYNTRKAIESGRFDIVLSRVNTRITYKELTAEEQRA